MLSKLQNNLFGLAKYAKAHLRLTALVLLVCAAAIYFIVRPSSSAEPTQYTLTQVTKGTVVATVTGSGQVSASNQVDLKPKASGEVIYIGVKNNQEVRAGALIAKLDATDAALSLESARLSLERTLSDGAQSKVSAQHAVEAAEENLQKAKNDLTKSYSDMFADINSSLSELATIKDGMDNILYSASGYLNDANLYAGVGGTTARTLAQTAGKDFDVAKKSYQELFDAFALIQRNDTAALDQIVPQAERTFKEFSQAAKDIKAATDFINQQEPEYMKYTVSTVQTNSSSWLSKTNQYVSGLLADKSAILNGQDAIRSAERSRTEKQASFEKISSGADPLDVRSQELSVQQRERDYQNYFVYAPFDGVITGMDIKVGDSVSGSSIGTLITKQKIAEISLNEVDVAKVKQGQKVTLTFDAIDDFTITGEVAEIDQIGAVSQGVVSYGVKIGFDTQDERVKAGMSVSASIAIGTAQDTLIVPNGAIKSQGSVSYVEIVSKGEEYGTTAAQIPQDRIERRVVETGLSDETHTEVQSGLSENEWVIARSSTQQKTTSNAGGGSIFGGGGGVRIPR